MKDLKAIFIDDGGVMNDNALRTPEWRRLVGEYFAPRLGGTDAAWSEANRVVFNNLMSFLMAGPGKRDYISWYEIYSLRWLREMAASVGVPVPEDNKLCLELTWQASDYITQRVRSAIPGTVPAIQLLYKKGFTLFTSSAEHSRELEGYLKGMGIREYFTTLYGSDIINQAKYSVEFYRLMFDHADISPGNALVVDDSPLVLTWAASLGAKTCLVGAADPKYKAGIVISSLSKLPGVIEQTGI